MAGAAQVAFATAGDDKPAVAAMAFIAESTSQARVSSELFNMTLGKANVREGSLDTALALTEWPRDLDLLVVDVADAADPVADAAALKTAVPGSCVVIGVGRINDVSLYRDLLAVGFADYLTMPLADGVLARAVVCPQCQSSRVEYPQFTRKFFTPRLGSLLCAIGMLRRGYYCCDCQFTWPAEARIEPERDDLGWPAKSKLWHPEQSKPLSPK